MSVVALVCDKSQAIPVVTWAARFALARNTELVIYYLTNVSSFRQTRVADDGEERFANPTREAIQQAIETVVRTRQSRKGRIGRYEVSVRHLTDLDPVTDLIRQIRIESPVLFVGAFMKERDDDLLAISRQVATRVACDSVVLHGNAARSKETKTITIGATGGRNDLEAIRLSVDAANVVKGQITVISLDPLSERADVESAKTILQKNLDTLELSKSETFQIQAINSDTPGITLAEKSKKHDLILIGSDAEKMVTDLLEISTKPIVGVFRRAPRLTAEQGWVRALSMLPRINPADYADLYDRLRSGSRWNSDFIVMMSLATAIATLGLLQSSPAVVIGSMLLAPLMTPMIGLGLALNRGNSKLAYASFRAIARGFLMALLISACIGFITPGSDLTPEILSRTTPNILDLLVALFSGAAAAYALARPGLAGGIAGVAIATALVPPLCATGIALAYGEFSAALGAAWLLAANILAIILAGAVTFRAMGLSDFGVGGPRNIWVSRVVIGLSACAIVVGLPLIGTFFHQVKLGKPAPIALVVTNETRRALIEKIENDLGVSLLLIGRPGIP